jgi:hypothetical protein
MAGTQRDIDWSIVFAVSYPKPGATDAELSTAIKALTAPLSQDELRSIAQSQTNPFPLGDPLYIKYRPFDPSAWVIPNRHFPSDYSSLAELRIAPEQGWTKDATVTTT